MEYLQAWWHDGVIQSIGDKDAIGHGGDPKMMVGQEKTRLLWVWGLCGATVTWDGVRITPLGMTWDGGDTKGVTLEWVTPKG